MAKTKIIKFDFHYCCSARFTKVYGKLLRSVRKQYGRENYNMYYNDYKQETTQILRYVDTTKYCRTCLNHARKNRLANITTTYTTINFEIPL